MNQSEIEERFSTFEPETFAAIQQYQVEHDPKLVTTIVHGIVRKYLPPEMRSRAQEGMQALNSFGIESVTLMEVILDIQDALGLEISDAELRSLKNFEDATNLLTAKVAALSAQT